MAQSVTSTPLKIGWIPYWNLLPLQRELQRLSGDEIEFVRGVPASVNKWLSEGKINLAPCSSVCLLKYASHEMAFPLGIASYGPILSVYIGLHHEDSGLLEVVRARQYALREIFRQALARYGSDARKAASFVWKAAESLPIPEMLPPPLVVTPASATSTTLARIIHKLWFGRPAYEIKAADGNAATSTRRPMELLIGDEALIKRPNFRCVIDLGEVWRDLTDLPFVFAVFQTARKDGGAAWRQKMFEAAEIAQARMRVEPSVYYSDMPACDVLGHPIDLGQYWKNIQYRLGPQHFKGLALYLSLARCLMPEAVDDVALAKIMRWEAMGEPAGGAALRG